MIGARGILLAAAAVLVTAVLTAPAAPLFDPDEGYYPATAAESVDAGAGWDPRINGERRWDKPILAYALIEASFAALGRSVPAARVPSAVEAALLVLLTGVVVSRLAGRRAAAWSAVVLATTMGVQIFSRVAHPEIAVVLGITGAELLLVLWITTPVQASSALIAAAAGVAAGYGVLAKGPVAIALPALMALVMIPFVWGRLRSRAAIGRDLVIGLAAAALVALPWYAAMTWRHGGEFLYEAVWRQNVGRYSGEAFRHDAPVWFYVLPALLGMFPWTAFLPAAFAAIRSGDLRDEQRAETRSRAENFATRRMRRGQRPWADGPEGTLRLAMAAAALTAFAFYTASASKLPHYMLVLMPPLSILIGMRIADVVDGRAAPGIAARATALLLAATGVALGAAPLLVGKVVTARELFGGAALDDAATAGMLRAAAWPAAVVLIVSAALVWTLPARRRIGAVALAGALMPATLLMSAVPLLQSAFPWQQLGTMVRHDTAPIVLVGPRAPSLTFFAGRPVSRFAPDEVRAGWPCPSPAWLLSEQRWLAATDLRQICHDATFVTVAHAGTMVVTRIEKAAATPAAD